MTGPETGWLPTTPTGDSVEGDVVRAMSDRIEQFAHHGGRPAVVDDRVAVAAMSRRTFWGNLGVLRRPDTDTGALARDLAATLGSGTPIALLAPWPEVDLGPVGLHPDGHPPFMVRPAGPLEVAIPDGVDIVEVRDRAALADWERTLIEGYPTPGAEQEPELTLFPAGALGTSTRFWAARRGGRAVGVAASHAAHGVVEVEFVATRPEERGRGLGGAVTAMATLADSGRPAALVASDPGRGVYEALGYFTVRRWTFWIGEVR